MASKIIIGSSERDINNIEPNWINEQINRRRNEGVPVCVRIIIEKGDINISLATSDCPSSAGIRRTLTGAENEILNLWNRLHLSETNFSSGNLVAFLKQLRI
ncbi:MAG: hypothetical protein FHK82_18215 [Sedimenticola thiotaurini]|uniref:Uncharacterized protein n=1 Tax=Sedimenticola thiotaurini TaxID=1543721 RepID=A0A558CEA7_9GAMM|nr:MAG: hypothetical protein FHK82_18215 [Sedimenticola thiotaurini]